MALKARMSVISRDVVFRPGSGLSPQETSAQFAKFASKQIAEIDAENASEAGHALPRQTFVDGRESDDFARVRPDGVIVATWALGAEVVRYVYDLIVQSAPKRSGRFAKSQTIYADGIEVETPEDTIGAAQVVISSTVPYARKIEGKLIGPSRSKGSWVTNQFGVYHAAAAMASSKYGNIAKIKFGTREVLGGGTDLSSWAAGHSAMIAHETKRRKQHARDSRQPAVIVTFN